MLSLKLVSPFANNIGYNYDFEEIAFDRSSPLGALGRRFESCRPDSSKPSHTSELARLAFLMENLTSLS